MLRPKLPVHLCMTVTALTLLGIATPAQAHPGHGAASLLTGFLHPLQGLDHLLAMVTVGLLAARMSAKRLWILPVAFVTMMAFGGLLGLVGAHAGLSAFEWGVGLSVLVLGLLTAASKEVPIATVGLLVALFAICHGYAHVAGMSNASAWGYFPGMLAGTAALHLAGLAIGLGLKHTVGEWTLRASGALIAAGFAVVLTLQWMG